MNAYNIKKDLSGMTLVIPDKSDIERDAVAKAWEKYGGRVIRIDRFWDPPQIESQNVRLYGNHIFCLVLAQKLNLELVSPPDDVLTKISEKWLKRTLEISTLSECEKITYPCFIKPVAPKVFAAKRYLSYSELLEECKQLDYDTPVIVSDIIEIESEVRAFILNKDICTTSIYEGSADINEAETFLEEFINSNFYVLPKTCVVDIGYISGRGWAVIEANAVWGAGLNGCDPLLAAMCIVEATKIIGGE